MAQQPKEEKKLDFSSIPRGAISIKGLPVSRNTRLPSIRSPRDLTLGAQPKRTFMPNIPVRREKKPQTPESLTQTKQVNVKVDRKESLQLNDRGRGRGRGKQIIQTQSSIFSEGIGGDPSLKKERMREAYQWSQPSTSRGVVVKKEKEDNDVVDVSKKMNLLLRDDFMDDGDAPDDESGVFKPIIFPPPAQVKTEDKSEVKDPPVDFNPDTAKEMNFDINSIAKLIKKEKGVEDESLPVAANEFADLLNGDSNSTKLVLIQFPEFVNLDQKMDDPGPSQTKPVNADSKISNKNSGLASISCLPEGYVGKLKIMKSGKARLFVGPVEFSLDSINALQTKHEVVSINTTDSNTGDLTVLGYVQQKIKFAPNEDCLMT